MPSPSFQLFTNKTNAATLLSLKAGKRLPLFVFLVVEAFLRENPITGY